MASGRYSYVASIGVDTTAFTDGMTDVNKTARQLDNNIRQLNKTIKEGANAGADTTAAETQRYELLGQRVDTARQKLEQLQSIYDDMARAKSAKQITETQWNNYTTELARAQTQLQTFQAQFNSFNSTAEDSTAALNETANAIENTGATANNSTGNITDFKSGLDTIKDSAKAVADDLKDIAEAVEKFGGKLLGAGKQAVEYSVQVGQAFEGAMSSVRAYSGASEEELELLAAAARDAGATTSRTAAESAQALSYMALAGWDTADMLNGLMPILRASEAGGADLARTSDLVTDSMSAMGIASQDLSHYLDVVSTAQSNANTTMTGLLEAYVECGGTMRNLNVPIEESATALSILANRGIKASEAGHSLNSIMVNLMGGAKSARKALEEIGVSAWDEEGNFKGLTNVLLELSDTFDTLSDKQVAVLEAQIGGKTQMNTLQALISGVREEWGQLGDTLGAVEGQLNTTAQTMQDNLTGSITIMRSALEGVGVEAYEYLQEPIREAVDTATGLLGELNREIKEGALGDSLKEVGEKLTDTIRKLADFAKQGGFEDIVDVLEKLIDKVGWCLDNFDKLEAAAKGVAGAFIAWKIGSLVKDISLFANTVTNVIPQMAKLTAGTEAAAVAQEGLNLTMKANIIVAVATAVIGLTTAIAGYIEQAGKAKLEAATFKSAVEEEMIAAMEARDAYDDLVRSKDDYIKKGEGEIAQTKRVMESLSELVDENGKLIDGNANVDEQIKILNETFGMHLEVVNGVIKGYGALEGAYTDYVETIRKNAKMEGLHGAYVEAVSNVENLEIQQKRYSDEYALLTGQHDARKAGRADIYDLREAYNSDWTNSKGAYGEKALLDKPITMADGTVLYTFGEVKRYYEDQKMNCEVQMSVLGGQINEYNNVISEYEKLAYNTGTDGDTSDYGTAGVNRERQAEAAAKARPTETNEDAVTAARENYKKRRIAEYNEKKAELDEKQALHKEGLDEEAKYYSALEDLNKEYYEWLGDDEEYWKSVDKVTKFNDRRAKEAQSAREKESKAQEAERKKREQEETKQFDKDAKKFVESLKKRQKNGEITWAEYYEELEKYFKVHVDANSSYYQSQQEELADYKNDHSEQDLDDYDAEAKAYAESLKDRLGDTEEYYKKLEEYLNSHVNTSSKVWKSLSDDVSKHNKKALDEQLKNYKESWKKEYKESEDARKEYDKAVENSKKAYSTDLYEKVKDATTGKDRAIFGDYSKRAKEIEKYTENYEKLLDMDGIPQGMLEEINGLPFDERMLVVSELTKMSEKSRSRMFSSYNRMNAAMKTQAELENQSLLEEANAQADDISLVFGEGMNSAMAEYGAEGAKAYFEAFKKFAAENGIDMNAMGITTAPTNKGNNAVSYVDSGKQVSFIFNVDGKRVARQEIDLNNLESRTFNM